jgi:superfamily II DNA or RNA helicase
VRLVFDRGTLLALGDSEGMDSLPGVLWDSRVRAWRAPAYRYAELAPLLASRHAGFRDEVREQLARPRLIVPPSLRPYQAAAVSAWELAGRRGILALPTGSGKTRTAIAAIARCGLRTLCMVPTRVLMAQWVKSLGEAGLGPIGQYGDGHRVEQPITVATFASAFRNAEVLGNRFDLLVVDEVHHFGSGAGDETLEMCTAGARLGLTATLPDDSGRLARLEALVGPETYRASVEELAGRYLSAFRLITVTVGLSERESYEYESAVSVFHPVCQTFFRVTPGASWKDFVSAAGRSEEGRRALVAWRRSRAIVQYCSGKRRTVDQLLAQHSGSRILVFAADNDTAYAVAREHLVQPISCDIGARERARALQRFARGELRILVSARVLNEGLDVPAAEVAILAGGSQGSREYVQRVGRVLRPAEGKEAIVYDIVTRDTFEVRRADLHRRALAFS